MKDTEDSLECWAVVEIMGHKKFAGKVSEQGAFIRVDVPACGELPEFSKLFGVASIYCITPCTEETSRAFARKFRERAFAIYELPKLSSPSEREKPEWLE